MIAKLNTILEQTAGWVWGPPMIIILLGAGLILTVYHRFVQYRGFMTAIDLVRGRYKRDDAPGEVSHFKALCTALSATVGLGNIAGVAVAIKLGGPGATLWMILVGLLGMATKFNECSLACIFRKLAPDGRVEGGGPMYYIRLVPGGRPLSYLYAFFIILGALGMANMFQANQVAVAFNSSWGIPMWLTGALLAVMTAMVILGGVRRIASVAGVIVPVMAVFYIVICSLVILFNFDKLPATIMTILSDAFTGTAATGGFAGSALGMTITAGVRRALFSCEAGLGTAATAHSMVKTDRPVSEGFVALLEPFVDTVVICTMTALAINVSGVWQTDVAGGVNMTTAAFDSIAPGVGSVFVPIAVFLFAYSTLISWSLYGEHGTRYIFGTSRSVLFYRLIFSLCPLLGALWSIMPIINLSDISTALLVIPNVWAFIFLSRKARQASVEFLAEVHSRKQQG